MGRHQHRAQRVWQRLLHREQLACGAVPGLEVLGCAAVHCYFLFINIVIDVTAATALLLFNELYVVWEHSGARLCVVTIQLNV